MRMVKLEGAATIDPRRHFLVVLTRESLEKRPLSLPIFEIENGRHGRLVDCQSAEGLRILLEGRNVLYVGATNVFDAPVRNACLRDVLEGLLATSPSDDLHAHLRAHLDELTARTPLRGAGAAA